MKVVYYVTINKNASPIRAPFYRLRPALQYLRWLLHLYRIGGRFTVRVAVSQTPPQEAWWWLRRTARHLWACRDPRYSAAAYSADRYLADMIEGGRWFDTYALEEVRYCWRRSSMPALIDGMEAEYVKTGRRYNVNGGEDYSVFGRDRFTPIPDYIDTYVPYE